VDLSEVKSLQPSILPLAAQWNLPHSILGLEETKGHSSSLIDLGKLLDRPIDAGILPDDLTAFVRPSTSLGGDRLLIPGSSSSKSSHDHLTGKETSDQWVGHWSDPLLGDNFLRATQAQQSASQEIVFIDSRVDNYQNLISGVSSSAEVVVLDSMQDGVQQISRVLAQRSNISAIHVVSHGESGSLLLGATQLTSETLANYADHLRDWAKALTQDADILVYGCDLASGEAGAAFVQQLSDLTGADIAASTNRTGAGMLGGDWVFEVTSGSIEAGLAFQVSTIATYNSVLSLTLSGSQTFTGNTFFNEDVFISGNAIVEVLGDLTISNLGRILGDGIGALDNLIIKATGAVTIGGLMGGGGLQNIAIEASLIHVLNGISINAGDLSAAARQITISSDATIDSSGRVELTAVGKDNPSILDSQELISAKIELLQNSAINASNVFIKGFAQSGAETLHSKVHSELLIAGTIAASENILIESIVDNNFNRTNQLPLSLDIHTESISVATVQAGATLTAGGTLSITAQTKGSLNAKSEYALVEIEMTETAIASIDGATLNARGVTLSAETANTYEATGLSAVNRVSGDVRASINNSTVTTGSDGISVSVLDQASLSAKSPQKLFDVDVLGAGTELGDLSARNELNRNTEAGITGSTVTVQNGNVSVTAEKNAKLSAQAKAAEFTGTPDAEGILRFDLALGDTLAANALVGKINAFIDLSTLTTTGTGDVQIIARDTSAVDATSQISSTSGSGLMIPNGAAASFGKSIAFNSIGWEPQNILYDSIDALLGTTISTEQPADVQAYILNSNIQVAGDLSLSASSDAQINATVSNTAESMASSLYGANGMSSSGILASNRLSGSARAYIDDDNRADGQQIQVDGNLSLSAQTNTGIYANTKLVSSSTTTNDGGAFVLNDGLSTLLADFTTSDGTRAIEFGDRVQLSKTYANGGKKGAVYEYMGTATTLNLGTQDYSDLGYWKEILETQLIPEGNNLTPSDSVSVGGIVVRNDLRSATEAYINNATVVADVLSLAALENVTLKSTIDSAVSSSGGSAFGEGMSLAVNGTIATNTVLSQASATITDSSITTQSGDINLNAQNISAIDATVQSVTSTGANAVGATLAFNTIGWQPNNLLFDSLDFLMGLPLGVEQPAQVEASILNSTINAAGNLSLSAVSDASLNATIGNEATSAASALFNATGMGASVVLANNRVSSDAKAFIDFTGTPGSVEVGAALDIVAEDKATIAAEIELAAVSSTTNNFGASLLNNLVNTLIQEYQYTNNSGSQTLKFGDRVRLADDYSHSALAGKLYQYMGTTATRNLGSEDYINFAYWKEVDVTDLIPTGLNVTESDAIAVGGMVVRNDVRGSVASYIDNANVSSSALSLNALETATIQANLSSAATASGGSAIGEGTVVAASGSIATNLVLKDVKATITNSAITVTGEDLTVNAKNTSTIDATVSNIATSGDKAYGATIAMNVIGWAAESLLFNALDGIIGDPAVNALGLESPSLVEAYILNSTLNVAEDLTVSALSAAQLNAVLDNQSISEASALVDATGMGVGGAVSGNMVSSKARAFIDYSVPSPGNNTVQVGGNLVVSAQDQAGIDAHSSVTSSSTTTNDAGLSLLGNQLNKLDTYAYTTASGIVPIARFLSVRLAADYTGGGEAGSIYRYIGLLDLPVNVIDLGKEDYSNTARWMKVTLPSGDLVPNLGNFTESDAIAVGGQVVINTVTGGAESFIHRSTVSADAIKLEALETAQIQATLESNASSSGGSMFGTGKSIAANGTIAVNLVLSEAKATITQSTVTAATGDLTLDAQNTSGIDARVRSTTSTGDTGYGVALAFNVMGLTAPGFLFNKVDTLIGDPDVPSLFAGQPIEVQAYIQDSNLTVGGDLTLSAANDAQLNATVSNATQSQASALQNATGKAIGAVLAVNKVSSLSRAFINYTDTLGTVQVGGKLEASAHDNTGIYSNSKIVSSSTTSNDGGASVISETLNDLFPADFTTSEGKKTIEFGKRVRLTDDYLDAAYSNDSGTQALKTGDRVLLSDDYAKARYTTTSGKRIVVAGETVKLADDYAGGGTAGAVYQYMGAAELRDLSAQNYSDTSLWKQIGGEGGSVYQYVGNNASLDLSIQDYSDTSRWQLIGGKAGSIYQYMGTTANLDLANQNYTDLAFWKQVPETQLIPQGYNLTDSDAIGVGGIVVLNEVNSRVEAFIDEAIVTAKSLSLTAQENATIKATVDSAASSSGGSAFGEGKSIAVNGTVAINSVLSHAKTFIVNSDITTTTGDVVLDATNTSIIDATTLSTTSTGDTGVGVTVAINAVGLPSPSILFNKVDALIGSGSAIGDFFSNPVEVSAYILNSNIRAAGDITLSAISTALLNAEISNEATSAASALKGASGKSIGALVATNLVSSKATAFIDFETTQGTIAAGGALSITAQDDATIDSSSTLAALSSTKNDGGLSIATNLAKTLLGDYQYTTKSGQQELLQGDLVRLDDDYSTGGAAGKVYRYIGSAATLDLGQQNYADTSRWQKMDLSGSIDDVLEVLSVLPLNITGSDSMGIGGLVVRNDVRSDVRSFIDNTKAIIAGDLTLTALETARIQAINESTVTSDGGSLFEKGKSIAVNGVLVNNMVLSRANAIITNSDITTTNGGDVRLDAQNTSIINAAIASDTNSKGSSVGVTLALNTIGWNAEDLLFNTIDAIYGTNTSTPQPAQVQAYIDKSTIRAAGAVELTATSAATINADIETASTAITASLKNEATGVSVGAIAAINKLKTSVQSYIKDSQVIEANGGDITLQVQNTSSIEASVSAPSLAIAAGTDSTLGVSVGFSMAFNDIDTNMNAFIANAPRVNAAGSITLSSTEDCSIDASATAASLAVGASTQGAKSISGAGAIATNTILGRSNAYAKDSALISGGNVTLNAINTATIDATILAASASGAASGKDGMGASLGASIARNLIGMDWLEQETPLEVQAYLQNTSVRATGNLTQTAIADTSIDAIVLAGSAAVVGSGQNAIGLSGSGVVAENKISTAVKAFVDGDGTGSNAGIHAGQISLTAKNTSTIDAIAGAASLAASFAGKDSTAVSIGVSLAFNSINNQVESYIKNANDGVRANGAVQLRAESAATIDAIAAAASLAAGFSGNNATAVSGAGAIATNTILGKTNAFIENSPVVSTGDVGLSAVNTSTIQAKILTASIAAAGSGSNATGASLGAAVASNTIGYNAFGSRNPIEVQAYIRNSSVQAGGNLTQTAIANQTIDALVLAGSVAIVGSGNNAFGLGGSGVGTENKVAALVKAFIDGDGATGIQAKGVALKADDTSRITANAGAASLAGAFSGSNSAALSVGIAIAKNEISNEVETFIKNADNGVRATTGSISLDTDESAIITALSAAASLSAAIAGTTGVAVSGAGAESTNIILIKANAYVQNSNLNSAGDVLLDTLNTSTITAKVLTASAAVGGGGTTGVGASIGAAVARNLIGFNSNGDRVPAEVQAYVSNASINAGGNLTLKAVASETIEALVLAGSAAIAAGGTAGVGASGAGASTTNKVATLVKAFIDGDGATGIQANAITLKADDTSRITATAGAASLAASFAGTGAVSLSIGVALAQNEISNEVETFIRNADNGVIARNGAIMLDTDESATITALSAAASASAAIAGTAGIALSGAGANATNVILTKSNAYVSGSVLNSTGDVTLDTVNTSTITAKVLTASAAIGGGGTAGVGASIGVATARNLIGFDLSGNRIPAEVQAYVLNSSINAGGNLTQRAIANGTIEAEVLAGSVAIAAGGVAGVGASGAGASTVNRIATLVKSFIDGDGATGIQANSISLTATDTSTIKAEAGAASLAVSFAGVAAVSLSIGVALAQNEIDNEVETFIKNADNQVTARSGAITLNAKESATITALSQAASASVAIAGKAGIALSGAGADSTNVILTKTNAYIDGSKLNSAGNVGIDATHTSTILANVITTAASAGGGLVGAGLSLGSATARNLIGFDLNNNQRPAEVQAYVRNSSINAGGSLTQSAISNTTVDALVLAGSVAVAGGLAGATGAGAGAATTNKIATFVKSYIDGDGATGIQANSVSLTANDTSTINANAGAASVAATFAIGGAMAIGVALAHNEIRNEVEAAIRNADNGITARTGGINLTATDSTTVTALSVAAAVAAGLIGASGAGADATSIIATNTNAIVDDGCYLIAPNGDINITANSDRKATATSGGLAASTGASFGVTLATATIQGGTRAYLDGSVGGARNLNVLANAKNIGTATSVAAAGGLLVAGNGTVATADVAPIVSARLGDNDAVNHNDAINVVGAVNVKATASSKADATAQGVSVTGGIGAGVSIAHATLGTTVNAGADANTTVNANSIKMEAFHNTQNETVMAKAVTAAGSLLGSGVGADATATNNAVTEVIVGSGGNLTATQDITLAARGEQRASSHTSGLSVGGVAGIGATYATTNIGGGTRAQLGSAVGSAANLIITADSISTADSYASVTSAGLAGIGGAKPIANITTMTSAGIDSTASSINVSGNLKIDSKATYTANANADGKAIGAVGVGTTNAIATVGGSNHAFMDGHITQVGTLNVTADSTNNAEAKAGATSVGLAGVGGGSTTATVTTNTSAGVGHTASISNTPSSTIRSTASSTAIADSKNTAGGLAGIGGSKADAIVAGSNQAYVNGALTNGGLDVTAQSTNLADAHAEATSAGAIGVGGALTNAIVSNATSAGVGQAAAINTAGALNISSEVTSATKASSEAGSYGFAGFGMTKADANTGGSNRAFMDGDVLNASGLKVTAQSTNTATADADATAAGAVGASGAFTNALVTSNTIAAAGNSALISTAGTAEITATSTSTATADSDAGAYGIAGIGVTNAKADVGGSTKALMNGAVTKGNLGGIAQSINTANADAQTSSAGLAGVGGAYTDAQVTSTTSAGAGSTAAIGTQGSARFTSTSNSIAKANSEGKGYGAVGVGITDAKATLSNNNNAFINGSITNASALSISATATNTAEANATASSAGLGAGSGANTNATIHSATSAGIGNTANIAMAGNIDITSTANSTATAKSEGSASGIAGFGTSNATANAAGSNRAYVDGRITNAKDLSVEAKGTNTATSDASAATGGLVGGVGANTVANATSTTTAGLGSNSNLNLIGNIEINARGQSGATATTSGKAYGFVGGGITSARTNVNSRTEVYADGTAQANSLSAIAESSDYGIASAETASGGAASIRQGEATASVVPQTNARIGNNANLNMADDITLQAIASTDADTRVTGSGGGIGDVGSSKATTTLTPTITASVGTDAKVFAGGDITIAARLGKPVIDPSQLSDGYFTRNDVTDAVDTIRFTKPHGLDTGDNVLYSNDLGFLGGNSIEGMQSGRAYSVIAVDDQTVKLGSEFNTLSVNDSTDVMAIEGNTFQTGDKVIYENGGNANVKGLEDGKTYYVRVIDSSTIKLTSSLADAQKPLSTFDVSKINSLIDTVFLTNHGYQTGDVLTYRTPPTFGFAASQLEEQWDKSGKVIDLGTNHNFVTGQQVIYRANNPSAALPGLTNGATYYIYARNGNSFGLANSLAEAQAGKTIDITDGVFVGGLSGGHQLEPQGSISGLTNGASYFVIRVDENSFKLAATKDEATGQNGKAVKAIDINVALGTLGMHQIGFEGIDLDASETTGKHTLRYAISPNNAVESGHRFIRSSGEPGVPQAGDGIATSTATASSGKLVGGEATVVNTTVSVNVRTQVGDRASMNGDNVTIAAISTSKAGSNSNNAQAGLITSGRAIADTTLNTTNTAEIGSNVRISTNGNFTLTADSAQTADSFAKASGAAGIAFAKPTSNTYFTQNTTARVGQGSEIIAKGDLTVKSSSNNAASSVANGSGGGVGLDIEARANLWINASANTTEIRGMLQGRTVNLDARTTRLRAEANAHANGGGLGGDVDAYSNLGMSTFTSNVAIRSGAQLISLGDLTSGGVKGVRITSENEGIDTLSIANSRLRALGGDTDAESTHVQRTQAYITAESGSKIETQNLYVEADVNANFTRVASRSGGIFDVGKAKEFGGDPQHIREINFNSDITFLSTPAPQLTISADGSITRQVNVRLKQNTGSTVEVDDINMGGGGAATFVIERRDVARSEGVIKGNPRTTYPSQESFRTIDLLNLSNKTFIINDVYAIGAGSSPNIDIRVERKLDWFASPSVSQGSAEVINPTVVNIGNYGNSDLILQGRIYNPHHVTQIINTQGNILSRTTNQVIETRNLEITANNGSIGTTSNRISAQLVQGFKSAQNKDFTLSSVNNSSDTIRIADHRFTNGQKITYSTSGNAIQGLRNDETYYVIVIDNDTIKLATTRENATATIPVAINLDTTGSTGTQQLRQEIFLDTFAKGAVALDLQAKRHNGDPIIVNVDEMTAQGGNVDLTIRQSVNNSNQNQQATYMFGGLTVAGSVKGQVITAGDFIINAGTSDTRLVGYMDILNNSKVLGHDATIAYTKGGQLDIQTGSDVIFTELTGGLDVRRVTTVKGDIDLTLVETADAEAEFFLMHSGATIKTNEGSVTLLVGDDFTMTEGTSISAGQSVTIRTDYNVQNPGVDLDTSTTIIELPNLEERLFTGVIVDVRGEIKAPSALITTNNQRDMINITNVAAGTHLTVQTYEGDELVHIGSNAIPVLNTGGTLNRIQGLLTLDVGEGFDKLILDDSADTADNVGMLTHDRLIGLGMGSTDQAIVNADLGIAYLGFENLYLTLGSGSDNLTVKSTITGSTNLFTADGHDTVNIETIAGETILRTGVGDDTVNVGDPNRLVDNIAAQLSIKGGGGFDVLNVDDSGDLVDNIGTLTDTQVLGLGMGGQIDYGTFEAINIYLGAGHDNFIIESTHRGTTDLNTADGYDLVEIRSIDGITTVKTGADDDVVNVGNLSNLVNDINALLTIKGGTGVDVLNVDDSGDTTDNNGVLTDTQLTGLGMAGHIDYGTFEILNIGLGAGNDVFTIRSTHAGMTNLSAAQGNDTITIEAVYGETIVKGEAGNDAIHIGNPDRLLNNIAAQLVVKGGAGVDSLTVDDSGDMADNAGNLTDTQLTGLGMAGRIDYGSFETLDVRLGSGSDVFNIRGTHKGLTQLDTGNGNDTVNIEAIAGETNVAAGAGNDTVNISSFDRLTSGIEKPLTVKGGTGNDSLNLDDSGNTVGGAGILSEHQIVGMGMTGRVEYGAFEWLNVRTGSGDDVFTIQSTHAGMTEIDTTGGNDTVNVETLAGETMIATGAGDDTVNVSNANRMLEDIAAPLFIKGGTGTDILNVDDSGDTTNNTGILSEFQIAGLGLGGAITYGAFEALTVRLGAGNDLFTIHSTHAGETSFNAGNGNDTVTVESIAGNTIVAAGMGDDTINVGNANQQVSAIAAQLTVKGSAGSDTLNIDNSGAMTDSASILTDTQITGLGMAGHIDYGSFETLDIRLGTGSDTTTIRETHAGTTNLNTSAGNDTVNVERISGETSVSTGSGDDTVNIGNADRTLNTITAQLNVKGGLGNDNLNIDNSGDVADSNSTLTDSSLTGLNMPGQVNYGSFESVAVQLGAGNDAITIESTHRGQTILDTANGNDIVDIKAIDGTTLVSLGQGDDVATVGSKDQRVSTVSAQLTIKGGAGNDVLNVVDAGNSINSTGFLTDTQLNGLGMQGEIQYSSIEMLDVQLGSGHDTFTIESTHQGQTYLNTNAGNDVVNVQSITGETNIKTGSGNDSVNVSSLDRKLSHITAPLIVKGGSGSDVLSINNSGDDSSNTGFLNDTQLSGLNMSGQIDYGSFESLDIQLGAGNNTFTVENTHSGETTVNMNAGNDKVIVDSGDVQTVVDAGTHSTGNSWWFNLLKLFVKK
jgi:hypothetical protein